MNLVEFFVELVKLRSLGHYVLVHEERRLDLLVASFAQKIEPVGDEGLVEVDPVIREEVSTVARYFCACAWTVECGEGMEMKGRSPRSRSIASNRRRTS